VTIICCILTGWGTYVIVGRPVTTTLNTVANVAGGLVVVVQRAFDCGASVRSSLWMILHLAAMTRTVIFNILVAGEGSI